MTDDHLDVMEEEPFSQKFVDESHCDVRRFLEEMEKKHGGLSFARLFQYSMALSFSMMELHQQVEEAVFDGK